VRGGTTGDIREQPLAPPTYLSLDVDRYGLALKQPFRGRERLLAWLAKVRKERVGDDRRGCVVARQLPETDGGRDRALLNRVRAKPADLNARKHARVNAHAHAHAR
jgi:hypothetical protein